MTDKLIAFMSLNSNNRVNKSLTDVKNCITKFNIDITAIQEPGKILTDQPFVLKANGLKLYNKKENDERYSLIFIIKDPLTPFVKVIENKTEGIFHIFLTKPFNCHIINVYNRHNKLKSQILLEEIQKLKRSFPSERFILMGDFNNYDNKKLDYFSDSNKKRNSRNKFIKAIKLLNFIDSYRHINPKKQEFTRWTLTQTKKQTRVTATRIDYIFISANLKKKISKAEIINRDLCNSDHRPTITRIDFDAKLIPIESKTTVKLPNYNDWPEEIATRIEEKIVELMNIKLISTTQTEEVS